MLEGRARNFFVSAAAAKPSEFGLALLLTKTKEPRSEKAELHCLDSLKLALREATMSKRKASVRFDFK